MIFCLTGAHRVGKTTLMHEIVKQIGTNGTALEMNLGAIQREIGFDSRNQSYSFEHRLKVQEYLIERMDEIFEVNRGKDTVCDRSPVDVAAYTLVHVDDKITAEQSKRLKRLIERCAEVAKRHVLGCLLIQPGISLVDDKDTSAKSVEGFIEHLNTLCFGLINDEKFADVPMYYTPRAMTSLDDRVKICKNAVARSMVRNATNGRKFDVPSNPVDSVYYLASAKKQ